MAKNIVHRYALSIVRTQCSTQEARLWILRKDKAEAEQGPQQYLWRAGSLTPLYEPSAFGEGSIQADCDADAIARFQQMLLVFRLIGRGLISRAKSDLLIQVFPKVSDCPFPASILEACKSVAAQPTPVMVMAA